MANTIHFFGDITKSNLNEYGLTLSEADEKNGWCYDVLTTVNGNEMYVSFRSDGVLDHVVERGDTYIEALRETHSVKPFSCISDRFEIERIFFDSENPSEDEIYEKKIAMDELIEVTKREMGLVV